MKKALLCLICALPVPLGSQSPVTGPAVNDGDVMVVGVAHDDSNLGGGINSGRQMAPGKVDVEPIAWITAEGTWRKLSCIDAKSAECKKFEREYLSKPHDYAVVSADGNGATVHVERMAIDSECFGIGGRGEFTGGPIHHAAVAAEWPEVFAAGEPARRLPENEAEPVRRALAAAVGTKLDSTKELRVYSLQLDGIPLLVIQRAFQDWASKPQYRPPDGPDFEMIFAIGTMNEGRFKLLLWKENTADDNEQILGLIHLKSHSDFLVTSSNNPEGNSFRVYGIRDGKPVMVLEGGGGEC